MGVFWKFCACFGFYDGGVEGKGRGEELFGIGPVCTCMLQVDGI